MVTEDTDGLIYSSLKSFNMWKLATLEGWCPLNSWTVESCPVEVVLLCGVALRCRGPSTPRCTAQLTVLLTLFWGVLSTWFALTNLKKSRCLFFSNSQDYSDLDVSFWVILNKKFGSFCKSWSYCCSERSIIQSTPPIFHHKPSRWPWQKY